MHSLLPLNWQEERVREVLQELNLRHEVHKVYPMQGRSLVVDFFLVDQSLVIECWYSESRHGIALTWVERNAAYVDLKFKRIKDGYPGTRCLGLVEVPQVESASVREILDPVMSHADLMVYSMLDFRSIISGFGSQHDS